MPIGFMGPANDPYVRLVRAYVEELDGLVVPDGPPRRMMPSYFLGLAETSPFGVGSVLYAAGAPHPGRRSFALRAITDRHLGRWENAVPLGAIAGE